MREAVGVGGRRERHGPVAEVEAGALGGRRDDRQRLDPELLELRRRPSQLDELAPAERSVQAAQEHQQNRAPAPVISQRHVARPMDGREREVWCWFARSYGCSNHGTHASTTIHMDRSAVRSPLQEPLDGFENLPPKGCHCTFEGAGMQITFGGLAQASTGASAARPNLLVCSSQ